MRAEEGDRIRCEISKIDDLVEDAESRIRGFWSKVNRINDEIGDEEDVRCAPGQNEAFDSIVTKNIQRLHWRREDLHTKRVAIVEEKRRLIERRSALYKELEDE